MHINKKKLEAKLFLRIKLGPQPIRTKKSWNLNF
jgi:hypothetical protein